VSRTISLLVIAALTALAAVRVSGTGLNVVPSWVAWIVLVLGGLEVLSVAWNVIRGERWNERTVFDFVSDALVWLPWP
jgi:hypothetical protein